jgi:hypothetical protein
MWGRLWHKHPGNVTWIFFHQTAYKTLMKRNLQQAFIVGGTVGQLYTYREEYKLWELQLRPIAFPNFFLIKWKTTSFLFGNIIS